MQIFLPLIFLFAQAEPGALTSPTPTVDRGEVRSGPPLVQEFTLKHTGGEGPLTLGNAGVGCGCARWALEPRILQPGESAKLTLTVNTLTQSEGPANFAATVPYLHGTTKGELILKLQARILREVSVDPPVLAVSTAGAHSQTITITDRRVKPFTVTKAESANAAFTLEIRPAATANNARVQEITWKVAENLAPGLHDDTLVFRTDDPSMPELRVPVKVYKRRADDVSLTPALANVRLAKDQEEASTLVQLRAGGKDVSITKAESKTAGVTARFAEGSGPVATIRVVVDTAKAGASGSGEVAVTLAEPKGATVVVPVVWGK